MSDGSNGPELRAANDAVVASFGSRVRLRLIYDPGNGHREDNRLYGVEMSPSEARSLAASLIREADVAEGQSR